MNVSRLIASIGGYFYSVGDDLLAVHLYGGNTADVTVGGNAGPDHARRPTIHGPAR